MVTVSSVAGLTTLPTLGVYAGSQKCALKVSCHAAFIHAPPNHQPVHKAPTNLLTDSPFLLALCRAAHPLLSASSQSSRAPSRPSSWRQAPSSRCVPQNPTRGQPSKHTSNESTVSQEPNQVIWKRVWRGYWRSTGRGKGPERICDERARAQVDQLGQGQLGENERDCAQRCV